MSESTLRVWQFTDTHLYEDPDQRMKGVDTYDTFKRVVDMARALEEKPDLVLLTGDISMDETAKSYDRVREIVEPIGAPIYFLPGNHDDFDVMWKRFVEHKETSNIKPDRSFVIDHWFIILLNSTVPGRVEGLLSDSELIRLDAELTAHSYHHAMICLHHNPVPFAIKPEEDVGLKNADALFNVIDNHKNVKAIVWGHVHSEHFSVRNGAVMMASPSTCIQFRPADDGIAVEKLPAAFRRIILQDDGSVASNIRWLHSIPEGLIWEGRDSLA